MTDVLKGIGCLIIVVITVVALSIGGLVMSGVIKVGNTVIDREVVRQSQQYITSVNTALLNYQTDYNSTTDPNRRASIIAQFCNEASKVAPDQITGQATTFYTVHCH